MRTTLKFMIAGLVFAAPLAAQDTTVVITNDVCTVKVDGKRLAEKQEKAACERMRVSSEKLRAEMGVLRGRLLNQSEALRMQGDAVEGQKRLFGKLQEMDLPELTSKMEAQEREISRFSSTEMPEMVARLRDEAGKLRELSITSRPLAALAARPLFGITIDTRPRETDRYGAYVSAVTPGGPADKAGIQSGDVITKVAGEAVSKSGSDETPGVRLIALIGKLEVGKAVDVELRRKNDTKTVKVTPENDDSFFAGTIGEGPSRAFMIQGAPGGGTWTTEAAPLERLLEFPSRPGTARFNMDPMTEGSYQFNSATGAYSFSILGGIEMVAMNPDLGTYFGTSDGVLILNVGKNESLGLKAGDVVLSVDGRKVTSPSALSRIIRSYEKGDTFKLQVMRQKKNETVTSKI